MIQRLTFLAACLALVMSAAGCPKVGVNNDILEKITFNLAPDLNSAKLTLVFKDKVQAALWGEFRLREYGTLFFNPYNATEKKPFEIGYELNLDIMKDLDFVNWERTDSLPNGMALGIGYPLVEVKPSENETNDYSIYGYVDVDKFSWLGVGSVFKGINDKNFPAGMTVSQTFEFDQDKKPAILAHVYGAVVENGVMVKNGGIALLANVKYLIEKNQGRAGGEEVVYKPIKEEVKK